MKRKKKNHILPKNVRRFLRHHSRILAAAAVILAVAAVLVVVLTLVLPKRPAKGGSFSELTLPENEYAALQKHRQEDPELLSALYFDGIELAKDLENHTWYYSFPDGAVAQPDPEVTLEGKGGIRIAFRDMQVTPESVEQNEAAEFTVYTGGSYFCGRLVYTTLPIMTIGFEGEEISGDDENETDVHMTLYDNREGETLFSSDGRAHVRGNLTREFPQKGFRLTLTKPAEEDGHQKKNKVSLLGLPEESDWLLYPAYNDQEKIRNVFSCALWKQSCATDNAYGYDTGIEYRYVELFLNDRYWGLYAVGYPISEKGIGLSGEPGEYGLYKATHGVTDENRIEFVDDEEGLRLYALRPQMKGRNDMSLAELWEPVLWYYHEMYENRDDDAALWEMTDRNNVLDYYLFINLIQGQDQASVFGYTNRYLAILKEDRWKAIYIPWDMDRTWGNSTNVEEDCNTGRYEYDETWNVYNEDGPLHQLIRNGDESVRREIADRYAKLREDVWSDAAVAALIDGYEADIYGSGAFRRDIERWPDGFYNAPEEKLGRFREHVMARLSYLDRFYADPAVTEEETNFSMLERDICPVCRYYTFPDTDLMIRWFTIAEGYDLLVQINDTGIWDDPRFTALTEGLGIDASEAALRPDMLVLRSGEEEHTVLNDFLVSGTFADTVIGTLSFFDVEGADYGLYQDGKQILTQASSSRAEEPFRFIFFSQYVDDAGDTYDPHVMTQEQLFR